MTLSEDPKEHIIDSFVRKCPGIQRSGIVYKHKTRRSTVDSCFFSSPKLTKTQWQFIIAHHPSISQCHYRPGWYLLIPLKTGRYRWNDTGFRGRRVPGMGGDRWRVATADSGHGKDRFASVMPYDITGSPWYFLPDRIRSHFKNNPTVTDSILARLLIWLKNYSLLMWNSFLPICAKINNRSLLLCWRIILIWKLHPEICWPAGQIVQSW